MLKKDEFVILNIWEESRAQLIERLDFYHEQAKRRVLEQFRDIEGEAERYAEESYDRLVSRCRPRSEMISILY